MAGEYWTLNEELLKGTDSGYKIIARERHVLNFFSIDELKIMFGKTGLKVLAIYKPMSMGHADKTTSNVLIVSRGVQSLILGSNRKQIYLYFVIHVIHYGEAGSINRKRGRQETL